MKRTVTIDVEPSPEELANALAAMDARQQATFFNFLYLCDTAWENCGWPMQLQYVTDNKALSGDGRSMMRMLGEYAEAQSS